MTAIESDATEPPTGSAAAPRIVIEVTAAPCTYNTFRGKRIAGTSYTATGPDARRFSGSNLRQFTAALRSRYPGCRIKLTDLRNLSAAQLAEYRLTRAAQGRA